MVKLCIKKLSKSFNREINVKFVTHYKTTKMSFFTNTKDKTPSLSQSSLVYTFTCTACSCILAERNRLYMKKQKNMGTLTKRARNKVQFMNTCQLSPIIVMQWTCSILIIMMLTVTNFTWTRLEVTLLFLRKQIIGTNCFLKKHY